MLPSGNAMRPRSTPPDTSSSFPDRPDPARCSAHASTPSSHPFIHPSNHPVHSTTDGHEWTRSRTKRLIRGNRLLVAFSATEQPTSFARRQRRGEKGPDLAGKGAAPRPAAPEWGRPRRSPGRARGAKRSGASPGRRAVQDPEPPNGGDSARRPSCRAPSQRTAPSRARTLPQEPLGMITLTPGAHCKKENRGRTVGADK